MSDSMSRVANTRREDTTYRYASGWLVCASMLLITAGLFNVMHGLVAINESQYLVNQLLFSDLETWGWIFLGWGALQVVSGAFAWSGSTWAAIAGNAVAMISMVLWFLMIFAAPFAAIVAILLNIVVVYGMTVGQDEVRA